MPVVSKSMMAMGDMEGVAAGIRVNASSLSEGPVSAHSDASLLEF
jgi:hypothetical protein